MPFTAEAWPRRRGFWGVQAVFEHLKGVTSAVSGYAGGHVESPGYESGEYRY